MITLKDFLNTQHQFYREKAYRYKIIFVMDIDVSDSNSIVKIKDGDIYSDINLIPKELYDHIVYSIEPDKFETSEVLYLKILLI